MRRIRKCWNVNSRRTKQTAIGHPSIFWWPRSYAFNSCCIILNMSNINTLQLILIKSQNHTRNGYNTHFIQFMKYFHASYWKNNPTNFLNLAHLKLCPFFGFQLNVIFQRVGIVFEIWVSDFFQVQTRSIKSRETQSIRSGCSGLTVKITLNVGI